MRSMVAVVLPSIARRQAGRVDGVFIGILVIVPSTGNHKNDYEEKDG